MAAALPAQIRFTLPAGWKPARPDDFDAPHAALAFVRSDPAAGLPATITIAGSRPPENTSLADGR